jgi:hypothetical protein
VPTLDCLRVECWRRLIQLAQRKESAGPDSLTLLPSSRRFLVSLAAGRHAELALGCVDQ